MSASGSFDQPADHPSEGSGVRSVVDHEGRERLTGVEHHVLARQLSRSHVQASCLQGSAQPVAMARRGHHDGGIAVPDGPGHVVPHALDQERVAVVELHHVGAGVSPAELADHGPGTNQVGALHGDKCRRAARPGR